MKPNNHVVWIVPGFAATEADSLCIPVLQDLAVRLLKTCAGQLKISVISLHYPYTNKPYTLWETCDVYPMGWKNAPVFKKVWKYRTCMRVLDDLHAKFPVHRVHAFWMNEPLWLAYRWASRNRVPVSATAMGQEFHTSNVYMYRNYSRLDAVFSLSEFQAQKVQKYFPQNQLVPWGFDPDFVPLEKKWDLVYVSAFEKGKNPEKFLDVLTHLKLQNTARRIIWVGSGKLRKETEREISARNLQHTLVLAGNLSREETVRTIGASRVLVHTSDYEGFGMVMAEALSQWVPVISTPVGCAFQNPDIQTADSAAELAGKIEAVWANGTEFIPRNSWSLEPAVIRYRNLFVLK